MQLRIRCPRCGQLFYLLNIIGLLVVGSVIYLLVRPGADISRLIVRLFHIPEQSLFSGGLYRQVSEKPWLLWINNFLPDMLWAAALTFTVSWILGRGKRQLILTGAVSAFVEVLSELLQAAGVLSGTFDSLDSILEVIATGLVLLIIILFFRRKK